MHSVEYEKKSNWNMYRATFPINGREIVVSKYIFGFGIVIIASILVFVRKYDLPEDDSGQNQYLLYWSCCKSYMD